MISMIGYGANWFNMAAWLFACLSHSPMCVIWRCLTRLNKLIVWWAPIRKRDGAAFVFHRIGIIFFAEIVAHHDRITILAIGEVCNGVLRLCSRNFANRTLEVVWQRKWQKCFFPLLSSSIITINYLLFILLIIIIIIY